MNKPGIHRVTPTSKSGRRMISIGKEHDPSRISQEVKDWNTQVEAKKEAKKQAKLRKWMLK